MNIKFCMGGIGLLSLLVFLHCAQPETPQLPPNPPMPPDPMLTLTVDQAERLSRLPLKCISQEYPNKPGNTMGDSSYVLGPRAQHPAFYGCFDWHSAVHGHWSLVRLLKKYPDLADAQQIRYKLDQNLSERNIDAEVRFFEDKHNSSYERTYGWAWLLKLAEELETWDDPQAKRWLNHLQPLTQLIVQKYKSFLPKLLYPVRTGEHPNTAFGLSLALDYALTAGDTSLQHAIIDRATYFYGQDQNCPINWEPGGFDFLSPCLEEAALMADVLPADRFQSWFTAFLPDLSSLEPAQVSDRSDGKLVHLDGLNLSRAWCLYILSRKLPGQAEYLRSLADKHLATSLANITDGDYAGEHWLGTFALYALSERERE
ncbi:MAG: DUF2891 domain-containing protein [Saprospiraceae bacterium]|nr:DUF2891 domain-containing protein [Saprospiraceae bacterium]